MKNKHAFSFIEMMVVVAIVAIITSIAVPSLLKSRQGANQHAAQSTLQTISAAIETYFTTFMTFPDDYNNLLNTSPPFINVDYCDGQAHSGYEINCAGVGGSGMTTTSYTITANPESSTMGVNCYRITPGGVLSSVTCW